MANVISYKGQKYVRVDSVTRKKVHRTDMVVFEVEANYDYLKELISLIPQAIKKCDKLKQEWQKILPNAKKDFAFLAKIKGNKEKIYELNEKDHNTGSYDFTNKISWRDDKELMREIKNFLNK